MAASRVGFYGRHEFYRRILAPVRDALDPDVASMLTGDAEALIRFRPHVILLAAHDQLEQFRRRLPDTQIGTVRHGLVSKGVLLRQPRRRAARWYDFLCAGPDDVAVDLYRRAGALPGEVWRTGYPQLDPLHRRDAPPDLGLDPARPTILYAPTWNLGLSSAPLLGDRVVHLIRVGAAGANVIIKPHPVVREWRPEWARTWERLAFDRPGVHFVRDTHADVTPFMLAADLMVSDASSVIFEYLALDRPMVVMTSPDARADPAYDPDDIIWRWRDVAAEVTTADDLPAAIATALANPDARADARRRRAEALFAGQTDGRNAARVAGRVSARSRELATRAEPRLAGGPRLALEPWAIADLARRVWQQPLIRSRVVVPIERLRLQRRRAALRAGRLRGPDGAPIARSEAS